MSLAGPFGGEGEVAGCRSCRQARQAVAGTVAGKHIGVVPAIAIGGGIALCVDGGDGLVDVHIAERGAGGIAGHVGNGEGVRLAGTFGGEGKGTRIRSCHQARLGVAGAVAGIHIGVIPAIAVGGGIALGGDAGNSLIQQIGMACPGRGIRDFVDRASGQRPCACSETNATGAPGAAACGCRHPGRAAIGRDLDAVVSAQGAGVRAADALAGDVGDEVRAIGTHVSTEPRDGIHHCGGRGDIVHGDGDGLGVRHWPATAGVAQVIGEDGDRVGAVIVDSTAIGQSAQGGIDVAERSGEGHGGGAIAAAGEAQASDAGKGQDAMAGRQVHLAGASIHIGNRYAGNGQVGVVIGRLGAWDRHHRGIVHRRHGDVAGAGAKVVVAEAIIDLEGDGTGRGAGGIAAVAIRHRAQGRLVVGNRRRAGKSQNARGGVIAAGDAVLVGKAQDILAAGKAAADRDAAANETRVVIGDRQGVVDCRGRGILGVGQSRGSAADHRVRVWLMDNKRNADGGAIASEISGQDRDALI